MGPATVNQNFLTCNGTAGVARQEENNFSDILRLDQIGNALRSANQLLSTSIHELTELTFGHCPSGRNAVHTNSDWTEFPRERASEADNPGFHRHVSAHFGGSDMKSD